MKFELRSRRTLIRRAVIRRLSTVQLHSIPIEENEAGTHRVGSRGGVKLTNLGASRPATSVCFHRTKASFNYCMVQVRHVHNCNVHLRLQRDCCYKTSYRKGSKSGFSPSSNAVVTCRSDIVLGNGLDLCIPLPAATVCCYRCAYI